MDAYGRLVRIPVAKKSRKKGRRDKPFRELKMGFITKEIQEKQQNQPKPPPPAPKPYVPQPITDFGAGILPKMAKRLRRKARRKAKKAQAKWEAGNVDQQTVEQAAVEAKERESLKRKAADDLLESYRKRRRTGEAAAQEVEGRQKLLPKSRKTESGLPDKKSADSNLLAQPVETLKEIFGHCDEYQRTCIALSCRKFALVIMQDIEYLHKVERDNNNNKTEKKKSVATTNIEEESKRRVMGAGAPDIRKRYNWDAERHTVMEHLQTFFTENHHYCTICRKWKPIEGGIVESFKNCPKKSMMAEKPKDTTQTTSARPSGLRSLKVDRVKPIPDKIIWTEKDWSVIKLGAIRSRMGLVQTLYLCPSCTDSRNGLLFPPQPEVPLPRFMDIGNPIGGDLVSGRVPYGLGPNFRDPRRHYPEGEKLATVDEMAREAGKAEKAGVEPEPEPEPEGDGLEYLF